MRYKIQPGDSRRFKAAFHSDECVECNALIDEGTPIGFLQDSDGSRYGPLCEDCLETIRTPMRLDID